MPGAIRHKILLVTLVCVLAVLVGFIGVFLIAQRQYRLVEKHLDLPLISESWFVLNNGIRTSLHNQLQSFARGNIHEKNAWEQPWREQINPALEDLSELYKKERVWNKERLVEARTFYDIRLMLGQLKDLQQRVAELPVSVSPDNSSGIQSGVSHPLWVREVSPLAGEISGSIEQIVHWQTDFIRRQNNLLQTQMLDLSFGIWGVALIVLLLVLMLGWFLTRQITAPLSELRDTVRRVKEDRFHGAISIRSRDEVGELAQEFQAMLSAIQTRTKELEESNRQLAEASRQKGMFLTSMSHELRTPLNAIIGFADTLLDDENEPLSQYRKDRLKRIFQSGKQLLQLINSLLDLSRIEAGQMQITSSAIRLDELVLEVLELLEPLIQGKNLKCVHEFEEFQSDHADEITGDSPDRSSPYRLVSDSAKLRQVLINLVGNAIKFTDPGGRIRIRVVRHPESLSVEIEDSGCGIPADQMQHIFEVFKQATKAVAGQNEGSGLGLPLVKSLLGLLGGTISVESEQGKGALFTIQLPLAPAEPACAAPVAAGRLES